MRNPGFEFDQELRILRVVPCHLDVIAGEGANVVQRLPKRNEKKMRTGSINTTQYMYAAITWRRFVVGHTRAQQVLVVRIGFLGWHYAVPCSGNHPVSSLVTVASAA
jgi:hypothetical protein